MGDRSLLLNRAGVGLRRYMLESLDWLTPDVEITRLFSGHLSGVLCGPDRGWAVVLTAHVCGDSGGGLLESCGGRHLGRTALQVLC